MMNLLNIIPGFKQIVQSVWFGAIIASVSVFAPADAYAACFSGAQARSIVASNGLTSLGRVVGNYRSNGAQVTSARLCSGGGGYVYRLTILTNNGQVKRVTVNARSGY